MQTILAIGTSSKLLACNGKMAVHVHGIVSLLSLYYSINCASSSAFISLSRPACDIGHFPRVLWPPNLTNAALCANLFGPKLFVTIQYEGPSTETRGSPIDVWCVIVLELISDRGF